MIPKIKDYPKFIYFKQDKYKVMFVKGLKDLGETDPNEFTIKIRAGMSRVETFKTFIHECLHVGEFSYPLDISHRMVYRLEEVIFTFLMDNYS